MGAGLLPREILEHILQFADGETVLMCREVSSEFEAAVNYLSKKKYFWKKLFLKEKKGKHPFCVISKLHPHDEGLSHPKNWGVIYETCFIESLIQTIKKIHVSEVKIGKEYSDIKDVQTHGDLILLLVKYTKDFSIFYKIVTLSPDNVIMNKSCRFYADKLYITSIKDGSCVKQDAIVLSCDLCHLMAVPVNPDTTRMGFPKFIKNHKFLTVEHSNGDVLWINKFRPLLSKESAFHIGKDLTPEEVKMRDSQCIKVFQKFSNLFITCGETHRVFNTFEVKRARVTASLHYSNLLILGMDTGMLYVYHLSNESELKLLDLECNILQFDICFNSILMINVMELKNQFVIVCCSKKNVYQVHFSRNLKSFIQPDIAH